MKKSTNTQGEYPFKTMPKSNPYVPLIIGLCVALVLAVCLLPLPVRTKLTMNGTEYTNDGSVVQTGTIQLDMTVYHYLFKKNEAKVNHIALPGWNVSAQGKRSADILIDFSNSDMNVQLLIWPMLETETQKYSWCDIFFDLNDPAYAIIRTENRIYVAGEGEMPDYQTILQRYGRLGICG